MTCFQKEPRAFNADAMDALREAIDEKSYDPKDPVYVNKVQILLGNLVTL